MGIVYRRFYTTLTLLAILLCTQSALGQTADTPWDKNLFDNKDTYKVAHKQFQKGESLYKQGVYSKALTFYLPAHEFNPNNSQLNMRIGQCYLYSSSKLKAKTYFQKALELNERINISIHLLLGHCHQLEMEWFRAIEQYEKFINITTQDDMERVYLA
ncbi:MAG: hypothetical protein JKX73_11810, partial [Flavobacteriales bacterium]|nr:hypothetical protein [Flavobacteriales bacterium]